MDNHRATRAASNPVPGLLALALALLAATPAPAATLQVNSTLDLVALDGRCTLREAISSANADQAVFPGGGECAPGAGADVILLGAGIHAIGRAGAEEDLNATGDFDLRSSITLVGLSATQTRLSGNLIDRVLHVVGPGHTVALRDLAISFGLPPDGPGFTQRGGGGVLVDSASTVTLERVVVESNGGGSGTAMPSTSGSGGGILCGSGGVLRVRDSVIRLNTAGDARGDGGSAGGGGGIAGVVCELTIERSRVERNLSGDAAGPYRSGHGGGISLLESQLTLVDSVVANNAVGEGDSGIGGGIYIVMGTVEVRGSSLIDNRATEGGAIGVFNHPLFPGLSVTLANSTISGNTGVVGGAVFLVGRGTVVLRASTLADNHATTGGALFSSCTIDGCRIDFAGSVLLRNSGGDCVMYDTSTVNGGYNAYQAVDACGPGAATDRIVAADALGPRVDDYAATPVHLPAADGPLVDGGSCAATAVTSDQAGLPRPQRHPAVDADDGCDIGAIELRAPELFGDGFE